MDDLNILISYYRAEENNLVAKIQEALEEDEYLIAHYHSRALYKVKDVLRTLNSFIDKNYNSKEFLKNSIRGWEKKIDEETTPEFKQLYGRFLEKKREELEKLNEQIIPQYERTKGELIAQSLKDVVQRDIYGLRLIASRKSNIEFRITYERNCLTIRMPFLKKLRKNDIISDGQIRKFQGLGFKMNTSETVLILKLRGFKTDLVGLTITVLSRIFFDILHFSRFEEHCYIVYKERASR